MKICFTETERLSEDYFWEHLAEHELSFVEQLSDVPPDTECLSIFIQARIHENILPSLSSLRFIATRTTGFDHIDLAACARRAILVSFVPSYGENTVAEHTFALLLALSRRIRETLMAKRTGHVSFEALRGFDLRGKTLGVVGAGRIGLHVIRIAKAFGMEVIATDIKESPVLSEVLGFEYVDFKSLLRQSDIISLHVPLTKSTLHLFDGETFASCRRGVIIINTSRGGLISTQDLRKALESGQVAGAGLDVLEDERLFSSEASQLVRDQIVANLHQASSPEELHLRHPERLAEIQELTANEALLGRSDVVFTPHIAFNSVEAVRRIDQVTLENIRCFAAGKPINLVGG